MSVIIDLTLPGQPASGLVEVIPLGGDGVNAPINVVAVEVDSVADASGGSNQINVTLDPRYSTVVQYCSARVAFASAGTACYFLIRNTPCDAFETIRTQLFASWFAVATADLLPPGMILTTVGSNRPLIRIDVPNTDTETLTVRLRMYNFVKELRQLAPNWLTMFNLPR